MMYGGQEKYTPKVRQEIVIRDEGVSQLRTYTEALGWHRTGGYCSRPDDCEWLQTHHIRPQRTFQPFESRLANRPENLILLAACQHVGRCPGQRISAPNASRLGKWGKWVAEHLFVVHKDMQYALMDYDPSRNSFQKVFEQRDEFVKQGITYWNTDHDMEMLETARMRSMNPEFWVK